MAKRLAIKLGVAALLCLLVLFGVLAAPLAAADSFTPPVNQGDIGSGSIVAPLPSASCSDTPFSGIGSFSVPADSYDVYARLGATTPAEEDILYAQTGPDNLCQKIGQASLNSDAWVKVGSYDARQGGTKGIFQLAALSSGILQSFNQPNILLVSQTQPACQPTTECFVTVNGKQGAIRPDAINGSSDTLFVVRAVDTKQDTIKQVGYYIDNRLAYSRPTLEPFDMRYSGAGKHDLDIVVHYKSGQRVILKQDIDRDWVGYSFYSYTLGLFYNQSGLLQYLFGLSVLLLIISLLLRFSRWLHRYGRQRRNHDARITEPLLGERIRYFFERHLQPKMFKRGHKVVAIFGWLFKILPLISFSLLMVILLNNFAFSINQVAGPSMDSTFADNQTFVVNRLGKTYSRLTKRDYIPRRGDVVVFRRIMDVEDPKSANGSELVIKRVLALPGERVTVKGSVVTVYNKAHPDGFVPDKNSPWANTMHLDQNGSFGTTADVNVTLQPGEVFVCGDNRPDSIDSRSFGPIQTKTIVGNVSLHFK